MKILYIVYYYFPRVSAATWSTYALSLRLAVKNDVILLIPNIEYEVAIEKKYFFNFENRNPAIVFRTPSVRLPRKLASFISPIFLFLKGFIIGRTSDLVLCQFHPHHFVFLVGLFLGKMLGIPVVARANDIFREMGEANPSASFKLNWYRKTIFNTINESFVKYADAFLVVCSENKEILESRKGRLRNVKISYNGVDPNEFDGLNREKSRKYLNVEPDEKVILFIGRFSGPEYRIDTLLKAFNTVQESMPNSILFLVGDRLPESPQKSLIINPRKVRVIGPVSRSEIRKYLAIADVCIGPLGSTRAIPLKVMEYMVCGKPVITGIGSVSRDVALDGYNCICVPPEPRALAEAILNVFKNEEFAKYLGANATSTALKFTWDKIAVGLEELLVEVVENHRKKSLVH